MKTYPQIGSAKTDWVEAIIDADPEVMLQKLNTISDALRAARQEVLKYKNTKSYVENWQGDDIPPEFLSSIREDTADMPDPTVYSKMDAFYDAFDTAGS